jgi:hypothetical protein
MSKTTDSFNLSPSKTIGSFKSSPSKTIGSFKSSPSKNKKSSPKKTKKENYGPIINKIVAPNNDPYTKPLSKPQISNVSGWEMPPPLPSNIKIG